MKQLDNNVQIVGRDVAVDSPVDAESPAGVATPPEQPVTESPPVAVPPAPLDTQKGAVTTGLASLRLSQDFALTAGVRKLLLTVPVRKPNPQEWLTVHPDPEMHFAAALIVLKEEGEMYVVDAALRDELVGEWVPMMLYPAINRQGVVFLWPVRLPGEDGRLDRWSESASEAAGLATAGWIRMRSNRSLGAYEVTQPLVEFPPPTWPDKGIEDLVGLGFKGRVISTADHPVLRHLRGEV